MGELKTSYIINLAGNLSRKARQYTQDMGRFSSKGQRSMRFLKKSTALAGRGLDKLGNRYTALLTGGAAIGAGTATVNLERRFTRLGIDAQQPIEKMKELKKQIFDVAQAPDIRIDPSQIISAIEEITQKTGDLDFAQANMRNLALAIQATGAAGKDIGGIAAEFQKMGITSPDQLLLALDILNVQGKAGAFTLEELATLGPKVVSAYTSMGRGGLSAIREMGAALQVVRQGTGESANAATAFEAMLSTISDPVKIKKLTAGGIKLFDEKEVREDGTKVFRSITDIMEQIIKVTKGDKIKIGTIFDREAIRAFNSLMGEYKLTGDTKSLDRFYDVHADGTETIKNATRAAQDSAAAFRNLHTSWQRFADNKLTGPIKSLTNFLNSVDAKTVQTWLDIAAGIAAAGAAAIAFNMAVKTGRNVKSVLGGGAGKGVGKSLATKVGLPAAVLAGGYVAGDVIYNNFVKGSAADKTVGRALAESDYVTKVLAFFGNDKAQTKLDFDKQFDLARQRNSASTTTQPPEGKVVIEIQSESPVAVQSLNAKGMQLDVDTGVMGAGQ